MRLSLREYPLATCLDGTPGGYYYRPAQSPEGRKKWYIHHEGGGWCQAEKPYQSWPNDDCFDRSKTRLGTLKLDNETETWPIAYSSADPAMNPLMHGWNSVYIRYCDGGTYAGRLVDPYKGRNGTVHFRGGFLLDAIIKDLAKQHPLTFGAGTDFVIGGSSAGGLAVYLHLDRWRNALPPASSVVGLADSGFFVDWKASRPIQAKHSYDADLRWGFVHMNASHGVNAECVAAQEKAGGDTVSDCIFAAHTLPHISTPIFILQSPYDSWQLQWEHGESKSHNYTALNGYGKELERQLVAASNGREKTVGGFIEHCYHHCTSPDLWSHTPLIDGMTQSTAFSAWYGGDRRGFLSQSGALPCKSCGCPQGSVGPAAGR